MFLIKAGYTPLHVAAHFGQAAMVRFLLSSGASVDSSTSAGYTPLHQAAQQGHSLVINLLLESKAQPNTVTNVSKLNHLTSMFISWKVYIEFQKLCLFSLKVKFLIILFK